MPVTTVNPLPVNSLMKLAPLHSRPVVHANNTSVNQYILNAIRIRRTDCESSARR